MKSDKIKISAIIVVAIILIGIGIWFYEPPKKANQNEPQENTMKPYTVETELEVGSISTITGTVKKDEPYTKKITIKQANLRKVIFDLKWTDDKTFLGTFGLDSLTLNVTTPSGRTYGENSKSVKKTKEGNILISISVNDKPSDDLIYAEDINDALDQLKDEPYYLDEWANKAFTVEVKVTVGEILGKFRPRDQGNDFELDIKYEYYTVSLVE